MTRDKDFKRLVRALMAATGEPYTAARAALLRPGKEAGMIPVTVGVQVRAVTQEQRAARVELGERGEPEPGAEAIELAIAWSGDQQPWLILTEVDGSRVLDIAIGPVEATSVAFALQGIQPPRPMTHDLLRDVVSAMGEAREVRVTHLQDTTFFAELVIVDSAGQERTVSCRPSDGIALAVRAGIPILVAEALFPEQREAAEG